MSSTFYDTVAQKFGGYFTPSKWITEYPNGAPENVFKEKLIELSNKDNVALDIGCADGRFTISMARYFRKIVAIDISEEMIKIAKRLQKQQNITNIVFEKRDAFQTSYTDASFDLIYNRRGPSNYGESYRLLKPYCFFVQIDIGEKDCQEIKGVFGRGQGFGEWDNSKLQRDQQALTDVGFQIVYAQDFFYTEYYPTYEDLNLFLQGVPIFEDFDSEKDKKFLKSYVEQFTTDKGIRLPRHRVVIVARK